MRTNLTKPCKECPFSRTSPPGYLGPWDSSSILVAIGRHPFPCHLTVAPHDTHGENSPRAAACAGAALHMNNKLELSHMPEMRALQDKLAESPYSGEVFKGTAEFLTHHDPEEYNRRMEAFGLLRKANDKRKRRT